jgi:hypothetical protein
VKAKPANVRRVNGKAVVAPLDSYLSRVELAGFPWCLGR